ncbi:DUF84 family protein [Candidatus Gracilibacteria bacterium 28_42_T64]|nr:DUF84 family protein [Candidatus Gracilibacteria bacterium 28_42_T64]
MKVFVGSKNQNKVTAVEESIRDYELFREAKIFEKVVPSHVSEQPKSLEETIEGAKNRAYNSYESDGISFGIEDGLMLVANTKSGFMNVCACVIYDGNQYHIGLSSAYESPKTIIDLILVEKLDMNQAYLKAGFTDNPSLGQAGGAIGILSKNRLLRKDFTKQAILTALIHLENEL